MSALEQILQFTQMGTFAPEEGIYRAETRAEINSRLLSWSQILQQRGATSVKAAMITATIGELGNNCFDHNLGKWKDSIGCLVSIDVLPDRYRIAVADRGQGIISSLRRIRPSLPSEESYLTIAFEEVISGRSPEKRGNGLKFVRKCFYQAGGLSLICASSAARYVLGNDSDLAKELNTLSRADGTLTVIDWSRP